MTVPHDTMGDARLGDGSQGSLLAHAREAYDRLWGELEPVGRHASTGGYRRYAWTAEDSELRSWFAGQCAERGLDLVVDRAGNQWGWWGDPDAAVGAGTPGLVIGSHLDSVPDGGAFDGPLGVISSFAAFDLLRANGFSPGRPIAIAAFSDEEGARFGVACAGSRLLTGLLSADEGLALTDVDGRTMAEAMRAAGHDPVQVGRDDETLRRVGAFVELHVEQGRGLVDLVDLDAPVAVGTGIWPHGRFRLDLPGRADHAGTTRLDDRDDPMLTLAAVVLAARESARRHGTVATIGKVAVSPNAVNAVPSSVTAWLDARGPVEDDVRAVVAEVAAAAGVEAATESWTATTSFDTDLATRLAAIIGTAEGDQPAPLLATGAGHDAGILAAAGVPTGMLFVRNPTGVSHSPLEHAETADCHAGVAAMARVIEDLAR